MFKKIRTAAIGLGVLSLVAVSFPSQSFADPDPAYLDTATVEIIAEGKTNPFTGTESIGIGTGFFIDRNMIITNHHVIDNDTGVVNILTAHNSRVWGATVVASDPIADLALVKIDNWKEFDKNVDWNVLYFSSKGIHRGDEVWVFGHPAGDSYSLSKGIISRFIAPVDTRMPVNFGSTDARMLQGNSGGPVLNSSQEVVGISDQIKAVPGGGLSYFLSEGMIQKFMKAAMAKKQLTWPRLGVQLLSSNKEGDGKGAVVDTVQEDSNASKAGILKGDKIYGVKLEDEEWYDVNVYNDLVVVINRSSVGDTVNLRILRDEEKLEIPVEMVEGPTSIELMVNLNLESTKEKEKEGEKDNRVPPEIPPSEEPRSVPQQDLPQP